MLEFNIMPTIFALLFCETFQWSYVDLARHLCVFPICPFYDLVYSFVFSLIRLFKTACHVC